MRSNESFGAQSARFAGMIALEEAIKLAPVFWLIRRGRIRNAHAAMLCGALLGAGVWNGGGDQLRLRDLSRAASCR